MTTLKNIQKCELDILKEFANICEYNNITYYLAYGTLLGAVRHKGFIPWDDDVDVYIHANDYKKLRKKLIKELSNRYFFQDSKTDRGITWVVPRIRDNFTDMSSSHENYCSLKSRKKVNQGLFIDIFLLVNCAKNEKDIQTQIKCLYKLHKVICNQRKISTIKGSSALSTIYSIFREVLIYRPLSNYYFAKIMHLQSENSNEFFVLAPFYKDVSIEENIKIFRNRSFFDKSLLNEVIRIPFEDSMFLSFKEYDEYLIKCYGDDYMTPIMRENIVDLSKIIITNKDIQNNI